MEITDIDLCALEAAHTPPAVPPCPVCGAVRIPCPSGVEGHWKCPNGSAGVRNFWTADRSTPEFKAAWSHASKGHFVIREEDHDPRIRSLCAELRARRTAQAQAVELLTRIRDEAREQCTLHCQPRYGALKRHAPECPYDYAEDAEAALKVLESVKEALDG